MIALLLSAGFGTRLKELTQDIAKPAIHLLGLPIMAYPIFYLKQANLKELIINTHYKPQSIHNAYDLLNPYLSNINTHFLHEEPDILLGGGSVKNAQTYLKKHKNFIYINADTFLLAKKTSLLDDLINFHNSKKSLVTLLTTNHPNLCSTYSALWFDKHNQLQHVGKSCKDPSLVPKHFTGAMAISTEIFKHLPEGASSIFKTILPLALEGKTVNSFFCKDMSWFELGTPQSFLETEMYCKHLLRKGENYKNQTLKEMLSFYQQSL